MKNNIDYSMIFSIVAIIISFLSLIFQVFYYRFYSKFDLKLVFKAKSFRVSNSLFPLEKFFTDEYIIVNLILINNSPQLLSIIDAYILSKGEKYFFKEIEKLPNLKFRSEEKNGEQGVVSSNDKVYEVSYKIYNSLKTPLSLKPYESVPVSVCFPFFKDVDIDNVKVVIETSRKEVSTCVNLIKIDKNFQMSYKK